MKVTVKQRADGQILIKRSDGSFATYAPGALFVKELDEDGDPYVVPFDPAKLEHIAQLHGVESCTQDKEGAFLLGEKLPTTPEAAPAAEPQRDAQGLFIWGTERP